MFEDLDLPSIADERTRELVTRLLNLLENVMTELRAAQAEIQRLRDEINRLKGEQGQPTIKPSTLPPSPKDISSEQERRTPKAWSKGHKTDRIAIDREQVIEVDPACLPPDAVFKGYEDVVVQDVVFRTDNVLFHKEKFYSPAQRTTYLAPLPPGYSGQFGPGIKSLALVFYFGAQMSEPKVAELLRSVGVRISHGQVSNLLIKDQAAFHAEKDALYQAGLASSPWQHLDDTSTRVNGQNGYCHIVCNPLYTAYFTTPAKDRLTILDVLTNHRPRGFLVNAEALNVWRRWGCRWSGAGSWSSCRGMCAWMRSPCRPNWRPTCPAWGRSSGRGSWPRQRWRPTRRSWGFQWCAWWYAMTRPSLRW